MTLSVTTLFAGIVSRDPGWPEVAFSAINVGRTSPFTLASISLGSDSHVSQLVRQTSRMSIRFARPTASHLRALADAASTDSLTYEPVGITERPTAPAGYRLDRWSLVLGRGDTVFERACAALRTWSVHTGAGLVVEAAGPPTLGSVVAMAAPLPVGWIEVVCRVVATVDLPDRFGFTYGTLSVHPDQGEESFTVVRHTDGTTTFDIVAVSRPRQLLARAVPPVARRLQRAATRRYYEAMQSSIGA